MRFARLFRILALGAAALSAASCQEHDAAPQKLPLRVRVVDARISDYAPVVALTGVIAARTQSNLAFRTGGRVSQRLVEVGDHVTPDTLLARLDPQEQQSDLRAAQASVDAAQAQLRQATATLERQKTLLAQGFTTRASYDQAEQAATVAQASLDAAQTQLQNARDALSYTELRAGVSGIVTATGVEAGQVVQAAQTIFTIAVDGDRDAVFDIDEALAASFNGPPTAQITLLSDPSVTATGIGRELSPVVDPRSGTIRGKMAVPDTPPRMTLGASVAGVMHGRAVPAVVLPWQAMFSQGRAPAVWTVDPASKAVALRPVTVLAYESGSVAISGGLDAGQQVVTAGGQLLRPGLVVEIAAEDGQ